MSRYKLATLAAVALAALVWTTGPANAQRRGGWYGGSGGGRGGYYGGYRGFYGGLGYYPGWGGYGYYPGYRYGGWGYGSGYGSGYYPGYAYGSYYPSYDYGAYSPGVAYAPAAYPADGGTAVAAATPAADTRQSYSYTPAADNSARIQVRVPADAEVLVGGERTRQRGTDRLFSSPPLTPGKTYSYEVTARWREGDRPVEQTRKVRVRANGMSFVDFTRPASEG